MLESRLRSIEASAITQSLIEFASFRLRLSSRHTPLESQAKPYHGSWSALTVVLGALMVPSSNPANR